MRGELIWTSGADYWLCPQAVNMLERLADTRGSMDVLIGVARQSLRRHRAVEAIQSLELGREQAELIEAVPARPEYAIEARGAARLGGTERRPAEP